MEPVGHSDLIGSPYGCSKCGEARKTVYTCRDGGESVRVCPQRPHEEKGCWWVVEGHPHGGGGYGCICLIPHTLWVPHCEPNTLLGTGEPCDKGTPGCTGEWHD